MTSKTIPAVNPDDLRSLWEMWEHLQEQKAGGMSFDAIQKTLSPSADIWAVAAHCIVLQKAIEQGKITPDQIDFVEAAKPISSSFLNQYYRSGPGSW